MYKALPMVSKVPHAITPKRKTAWARVSLSPDRETPGKYHAEFAIKMKHNATDSVRSTKQIYDEEDAESSAAGDNTAAPPT
jgi:hypothetical protein